MNKDDNLVMFESNIKYNDIQKAKVIISKLNISITDSTSNIIQISSIIDYDLDLGDMQTLYSDLISSYIQYYQFYTNNTFEINILALKKKRKQEEENLQLYIAKKDILKEQYKISNDRFIVDSLMFEKGGISQSELNNSKGALLQIRASFTDIEITIINIKGNISKLSDDLELISLEYRDKEQSVRNTLKKNILFLKSAIHNWENIFIIKAPVDGVATFTTFWGKNQYVHAGELVLSVVPTDSLQVKVRINFPIQNSGKVKVGQQVNIKLDNYPFQEFGILVGYIKSISQIPSNEFYTADIILESGLKTSYRKKIPKVQLLTGNAEIEIDKTSLLVKMIVPLKGILKFE